MIIFDIFTDKTSRLYCLQVAERISSFTVFLARTLCQWHNGMPSMAVHFSEG